MLRRFALFWLPTSAVADASAELDQWRRKLAARHSDEELLEARYVASSVEGPLGRTLTHQAASKLLGGRRRIEVLEAALVDFLAFMQSFDASSTGRGTAARLQAADKMEALLLAFERGLPWEEPVDPVQPIDNMGRDLGPPRKPLEWLDAAFNLCWQKGWVGRAANAIDGRWLSRTMGQLDTPKDEWIGVPRSLPQIFVPLYARLKLAEARSAACLGDPASVGDGVCWLLALSRAMSVLKSHGLNREGAKFFSLSKSLIPELPWMHDVQTPGYFVTGLRAKAIWRREDSPELQELADLMEAHYEDFLEEFSALQGQKWVYSAEYRAYPHLVSRGSWHKWTLYKGHVWSPELCDVMPRSCDILRGRLPGERRGLPYRLANDEEVVIFSTAGRANVETHNGDQNVRLNIHMGLKGVTNCSLSVRTPEGVSEHPLQPGKVTAIFDDSFDHAVYMGTESAKERIAIAVGVMHPDIYER
eukprot:gnl/TRDRNA2_/TRDRNA2_82243_c1_seq2.p1 gnl/TRDRNA2_/TRDRNA2_82243_c1~~gnl/TRDRNA2_/TRDRNA2_82243_c1_seq2.p1  ORF type:complete len:474 (-),score=74.93 gnl/TRDRNA2_/TRDRNA2_82243_c1_seq2:43-1464(-)